MIKFLGSANANYGLFGPASGGSAGAVDMRHAVLLDLPSLPQICQGRLTLESGVAISTSNQSNKTTVYFTPYGGNLIALYDGSAHWDLLTFSETSLSLGTLTSGKQYDVFGYNNSGTLALELSAAWTNDTTRADALTTQDGVYVKSGTTTRRYLGTFRTVSTTQTTDANNARLVWNAQNRVPRHLTCTQSGNWTYTTDTLRSANANTTAGQGRVTMVLGLAESLVWAECVCQNTNGSVDVATAVGIGLDSTSADSSLQRTDAYQGAASTLQTAQAVYAGYPAVGFHFLQWLERSQATGTTTWYGSTTNYTLSGLTAWVMC